MWMICARRPLRLDELQEAVAFESYDKSWKIDKIPDGDKIIRSCHGLVIRDADNGNVRLAHHTVQQYLVSPQESVLATELEEVKLGAHFWPELDKLRCDPRSAEGMAGRVCVTYLCFSDFGTAVSRIDDRKIDVTAAFKGRGPISIPTALGLGKSLNGLPYKFFGSQNNFKMPVIDYSKYLNLSSRDRRPSPGFKSKFALLEYVIEYWTSHTRWMQWSSMSDLSVQFEDLVQHRSLAFEFRPWGSNQHFGPYGCKGCPVPEPNDLEAKDLPSIALLHWAAETGHLRFFEMVKPLEEYLKHERHHDETLLIACRHGQYDIIEFLMSHRSFDFSNGRAILAACAFGHASVLELLLQASEGITVPTALQDSSSALILRNIGPVALYQAASNGHKSIAEILLARGVEANIRDTATGLTPLLAAAKNGHLQVVRALNLALLDDWPYAMKDMDNMTAVHHAAANGHDEIVTFLIQHGWGCDDTDFLGETALIKASQNGHAMAVKVLLEAGADPLARGGEGWNVSTGLKKIGQAEYGVQAPGKSEFPGAPTERPVAIHHAASNGHENVIAILPYSDVACGNERTNALHLGAAFGHPNVVQALLLKGAQIQSRAVEGMTALHYASEHGHSLVIELLLDRGCKINQTEDDRYTALYLAAGAARTETIKLLVARGADLTAKIGYNEDTALHLAARCGDADTVRCLVSCGALVEDQNRHGRTPLDEAVGQNKPANALALIELGAVWIRERVFNSAVDQIDRDVLDMLLSMVPTVTEKEQRQAVSLIDRILESVKQRPINKQTARILKTWRATRERE